MKAHAALLLLAVVARAQAPQAPELPSARLEGQVVDPMHQPVANARVVAELDGREIARTQTDGSGTFVFARVPQQFVVVRATTAAPDIGAVQIDLLGEVRGFARVVLMPARKVSGTVKDEQGKPVAGAWVVAAPSDAQPFAFASCRTQSDAQGRYELTHVAMGKVNVRAWAEKHDAFEGDLDPATNQAGREAVDEVLDCVVDTEGRQLLEVMLAGATAEQLAHAELRVQAFHHDVATPLPPPIVRPEPSAPGTWVVRGWPNEDEMWVSLVLPDVLVEPSLHVVTAGVGKRTATFRVVGSAAALTGVLTGRDGLAAAGRTLFARPIDGPIHNATRILGRSASDGSFVMPSPVAPGSKFAVRMLDPEAVVAHGKPDRSWFVGEHEAGRSHSIPIQPAGSIRLRVVAGDTPVHGAAVLVFAALDNTRWLHGIETALRSYGQPLAFGTSDLDGNVAILGLDLRNGDSFTCLVRHASGFAERAFTITGTSQPDLESVALAPTGTLVVTTGSARQRVEITPPTWWEPRMLVMPGSDGRLALPGLLPGDYELSHVDPRTGKRTCTVPAGAVIEWPPPR